MELNFEDEDFRERVRQMLRGQAAGQFRFCDDHDSQNPTEAQQLPPRVLTAVKSSNLIGYGCLASTEDNPDQGVEMTVKDDGNFWSSTGSPHDVGEEFLLYKLKHPLSRVRAVEVQVYRAAFQGGGPIYPAKHLLIEVGHSPSTMRTVGGPYMMACTDMPQTFLLPPSLDSSAIGSYAAIRFRGKYQKQHFDDYFYLSMRYVRVMGSTCAPHEVMSMRSWIARPLPPPDVLGPACASPSLSLCNDTILGNATSPGPQQQVMSQNASTCVIELPSWAQRDIVSSLCEVNEHDGRSGGAKQQSEDKASHRACCEDGATTSAHTMWLSCGVSDCLASRADLQSLAATAHTTGSSHTSTGLWPHTWGLRREQAAAPVLGLYGRRRQLQATSTEFMERMRAQGSATQWRSPCSPEASSAVNEDAEQYSLPPIEPLRTGEVGLATPSCRMLHSHPVQQGPLQHSVDEHGFLRCIIWERKYGAATAQQSCEGADDSEVEAPRSASRSHPQHAPLLVRNRMPSCISDCIQLVGARKRAASTAGIGSPLKAARESSSLGGTCTVADLHEMLFGQVQSVQFAVPLD